MRADDLVVLLEIDTVAGSPSDVAITLEFTACLAPRRLRRPAAATVVQGIHEMVAERHHELMPDW